MEINFKYLKTILVFFCFFFLTSIYLHKRQVLFIVHFKQIDSLMDLGAFETPIIMQPPKPCCHYCDQCYYIYIHTCSSIRRPALYMWHFIMPLACTAINLPTQKREITLWQSPQPHSMSPRCHCHFSILSQPDECLTNYDPHGYCVIYSAADRSSFSVAEQVLQVLWTNQNIAQKAVILVSNKADLARSRLVTSEGKRHVIMLINMWEDFGYLPLPH